MTGNLLNQGLVLFENEYDEDGYIKERFRIRELFTDKQLILLYNIAVRTDIPDLNEKGDMIEFIIGPEFQRLGSGTNRIAFLHEGYVYKFALDRRGVVDNYTEFKRSADMPGLLTKTYECNMIILVAEYCTLMSNKEFMENATSIKAILKMISSEYVFTDLGLNEKNYANWGWRTNGDIVILDYGYLYKRFGNEHIFKCDKCGGELKYNNNFTKLVCNSEGRFTQSCGAQYDPDRIIHKKSSIFDDFEDALLELGGLKLPDLDSLNTQLGNMALK